MAALDDRLLELALQASSESLMIVDGSQSIVWANLAVHEKPESLRGTPLDQFLAGFPPAINNFTTELAQQLSRKLSLQPSGQMHWRDSSVTTGHVDAAELVIRWHLLAELPERYLLLSLQNRARRRSDPGPAKKALRSQQMFMNQLIHELRTPLAIALGSLRRVGLKLESAPARSHDYLDIATQELKRMQRLIDHLSVLTEIDAGHQRWKPRPAFVQQVLTEWSAGLAKASRERITFMLAPDVGNYHLLIDSDAFSLVLNNLVDNALRFSPSGQTIVILVLAHDHQLKLYVADWGAGIPVGLRDAVFDRFRRLEQHRDPSQADGTGLGLAVCRAVLAVMHGKIELVASQDDGPADGGPGTIMKLCLPLLNVKADVGLRVGQPWKTLSSDSLDESVRILMDHLVEVGELPAELLPFIFGPGE